MIFFTSTGQDNTFKTLKKKTLQDMSGKGFSRQTSRGFIITRYILEEILKGALQAQMTAHESAVEKHTKI